MTKLSSILRAFSLLLICAVFLITCKKEYSYEGGLSTGTAVYTLVSAGGNCIGSVVNGKYYVGTALNSTNTIQLQVDVTTVGTYNLFTNTVDGIQFDVSGTFINTGVQTIILTGNGVPLVDSSFNFTTPTNAGCFFTVVVEKAHVVMASFTLVGAPNTCTNAYVYGNYTAGTALKSSNLVEVGVDVIAVGAYTLTTDTLNGIWFACTGTFTTTGTQVTTLHGYGIPNLARNLTFKPEATSSNCTFPLTVLTPGPPAIYVLESGYGTSNPCISTVSGNYVLGTALSSLNTVTIRVYVTYAGSFTIATSMVDNMNFAYTGSFSTTGIQYVTLVGTGKPNNSGNYLLIPEIVGQHPLGGQTCGVSIQVN